MWEQKGSTLFFTPDDGKEAYGYIEILGFNGIEVKWGVLAHWRGPVPGIRWSGRVTGIQTARKIVEDMWAWTMGKGKVQPPKEALVRADGKWGKDAYLEADVQGVEYLYGLGE